MPSAELKCVLLLSGQQLITSCLVARRSAVLEEVRDVCVKAGLDASRIILVPADITKVEDLINVRDEVVKCTSPSWVY